MSTTKLSKFELLPGEIRNQIYKYILDPEYNKKLAWELSTDGDASLKPPGTPVGLRTDILRVNRKIYNEAQYGLYEQLGPVVTVQCNSFAKLFNFAHTRTTWHRKTLPKDTWKQVCGREAHLDITLNTADIPVADWSPTEPEVEERKFGQIINHAPWKGVIAFVGMNEIEWFVKWLYLFDNQGIEGYQLTLAWTFNDDAKSALARIHSTNDFTQSVRKRILDTFVTIKDINFQHSISNPLGQRDKYIQEYFAVVNSPIYWGCDRILQFMDGVTALSEDGYSYLSVGGSNLTALDRALGIYEALWRTIANHAAQIPTLPFMDELSADEIGQVTEGADSEEPLRTWRQITRIMVYNCLLARLRIWARKKDACLQSGTAIAEKSEKLQIDESFAYILSAVHKFISTLELEQDARLRDKCVHLQTVLFYLDQKGDIQPPIMPAGEEPMTGEMLVCCMDDVDISDDCGDGFFFKETMKILGKDGDDIMDKIKIISHLRGPIKPSEALVKSTSSIDNQIAVLKKLGYKGSLHLSRFSNIENPSVSENDKKGNQVEPSLDEDFSVWVIKSDWASLSIDDEIPEEDLIPANSKFVLSYLDTIDPTTEALSVQSHAIECVTKPRYDPTTECFEAPRVKWMVLLDRFEIEPDTQDGNPGDTDDENSLVRRFEAI
ncbi:hypothetical protein AA313_de0200390 [Arthrobotrys entomopaga]|nr:hypothetical protein AA313_de0200390 [Arthrobotrys entomopaga]